MERLYFGPRSASGIFHNEVRTAINGLKSTPNIHDNLLVWGIDEEDHLRILLTALVLRERNIAQTEQFNIWNDLNQMVWKTFHNTRSHC